MGSVTITVGLDVGDNLVIVVRGVVGRWNSEVVGSIVVDSSLGINNSIAVVYPGNSIVVVAIGLGTIAAHFTSELLSALFGQRKGKYRSSVRRWN